MKQVRAWLAAHKVVLAAATVVLAAVIGLVLALALGGSSSRCTASNTTLQCQLAKQPPPGKLRPTAGPTLLGVDFAWSKVSPANAGSFGASYASTDPSKNWSRSLVAQYHAAGKGTVAVWETSANRAEAGCAAGRADAQAGEAQLASWGFPRSHLDMAIDFDARGPEVLSYFTCANQAYPGLIGDYGGYDPTLYLSQHGVTHKSWQTYAWSGGRWLPASIAPLEQYLNGNTFDHDRAIDRDYGQFPTPAPPGPSAADIAHWRQVRNQNFAAYRKHNCTLGIKYPCSVPAAQVLNYQQKLWAAHPEWKWHCWGPRARSKTYVCWIVRPEVSYWSGARDASRKVLHDQANGCYGPVGLPYPVHNAFCDKFRQRTDYFAKKVADAMKAY